jgi:uncharacterized membrane protein
MSARRRSTAVVIGAMLIATLSEPLLTAGLAVTQGDVRLFRTAVSSIGVGGATVPGTQSLAFSAM